MPTVTLHGAVPVYVQIDTDSQEVQYVCVSDEEFFYVGERHEEKDTPGLTAPTALVMEKSNKRPLAYTANGDPIDDHDLIEKARAIAESNRDVVGDKTVDWPAWSFGW